MRFANSRRLIAFVVPGLMVRCVGDDQLWLADPTDQRAWIAAEDPVDLRDHR